VRYAKPEVDMSIFQEVLDKVYIGLPGTPLPLTTAKRRVGAVYAARGVAHALTGPPNVVEAISLRPIGASLGRVVFTATVLWADLRLKTDNDFELCARMLVPLYASRAAEVVLYGREGATLMTAPDVAAATRLAIWLAAYSTIHPTTADRLVVYNPYAAHTQYVPTNVVRRPDLACPFCVRCGRHSARVRRGGCC
jgi:ATP-dependent Zn protease